MSITATRRVSSATTSSKVDKRNFEPNNHSQFVEHIDTNNSVLVRDGQDNDEQNRKRRQQSQTDFNSASPDISGSIEALAVSGIFEDDTPPPNNQGNKVSVYSNNQSIIRDEEIERTGRNYLKHFYEKNEHIEDVDEFI